MTIRDLSLEMSLKPFTAPDGSDIEPVLRTMFRQWGPLISQCGARAVSIMLWTGDGSEVLDYRRDPEARIEWGYHIGYANQRGHHVPNDPDGVDPHSTTSIYMDAPVPLTYRRLARITTAIRAVAAEILGSIPVRIGTTFEPGPELAKSSFKYGRHPEICAGKLFGHAAFVSCCGVLHADRTAYAAFPDGIPEGLTFGSFFGAQCREFLSDLDFDFIWFSNGFGFGIETLATIGAVFDGRNFIVEQRFSSRDKILGFWRDFRTACPERQVRLRGTNLTTGIDLSTDGAPIREIFGSGFGLVSPPNSPWAALDGNFGMELAGWMSHIAELPPDEPGFLFRFYTHDPWWKNSPWIDRYGREPHDIWLPLAVSRIDGSGTVETPSRIAFLTVDDSYGRLPESVPREVTPIILDALAHAPDAPAPVVWAYPFDEYHEHAFGSKPRLDEPFAGDWLVVGAINEGLPVNSVVTTRNFIASLATSPELYRGSVILTPVPDPGTAWEAAVLGHVRSGGRALLYGPIRHAGRTLLDLLGLAVADTEISGELEINWEHGLLDTIAPPTRIIHRTEICAGGVEAVAAGSRTLASVAPSGRPTERRSAASHRADPTWGGGAVAWVRGTVSASYQGGNLLAPDDPASFARGEALLRYALGTLGWSIGLIRRPPQTALALNSTAFGDAQPFELVQLELAQRLDAPVLGVHRSHGALWLSGYTRDTTIGLRLRFPSGAPLLIGAEAWLQDGHAEYHLPRAWQRECRVFVQQASPGMVSCSEATAEQVSLRRRILVRNLRNATVTVLPEPGTTPQILANAPWPHVVGEHPTQTMNPDGSITCTNVTGSLRMAW